jgi:uncharacterized SAM-binding protein YcdF (DUF218 family)
MFAIVAGATVVVHGLSASAFRALEHRFPPWSDTDATKLRGIIVLGGGVQTFFSQTLASVPVTGAGERVTAATALASRFPNAVLLFSGSGEPNITSILGAQGIRAERVLLETRSNSTAENAKDSAELVQPGGCERWILVTSAYHMPRAIGTFRQRGFHVEAFPVDYRSADDSSAWLVWREFAALVAYRAAQYTNALLPSPFDRPSCLK